MVVRHRQITPRSTTKGQRPTTLTTPAELHVPDNAFAFFHEDQLIGFDIFQGIYLATGPADFQQLHFVRFAQTKVDPQIILREVAATAADLVNLLMRFRLARGLCDATQPGADAAAV